MSDGSVTGRGQDLICNLPKLGNASQGVEVSTFFELGEPGVDTDFHMDAAECGLLALRRVEVCAEDFGLSVIRPGHEP